MSIRFLFDLNLVNTQKNELFYMHFQRLQSNQRPQSSQSSFFQYLYFLLCRIPILANLIKILTVNFKSKSFANYIIINSLNPLSISPMSKHTSPFKKKKASLDFSDHIIMTSSAIVSHQSTRDQIYLKTEKELNKLNKKYDELTQKHQKIKTYAIQRQVELQMSLDEANTRIKHLTEEKGMLLSRIKHLQKQSGSFKKSYERPLNRSINKSLLRKISMENSSLFNPKTERSHTSNSSVQELEKTKKFVTDCVDSVQENLSFKIETIEKINFDKNQKNKKALITDENDRQCESYCSHKKCIQNYQELQFLRSSIIELVNAMEDIYMRIQFEVDRRLNHKDVADFKLKMQLVSKEYPEFSIKGKPEYLMSKLEEKMKDFVNGPSYKKINPLINKVNQKIKEMKREEQAFREEMACEWYNAEQERKQIEKLAKQQHRRLISLKHKMVRSGNKNEKLERMIEEYQQNIESSWKAIGLRCQ